jgi:hypothetical protein
MAEEAEKAAITDESSAVAHVKSLLEPAEGEPTEQAGDEKAGEVTQEAEAEEAPAEEPAEEAEEASAEDTDESEPDGEGEELPDTLEGFAKELGIGPDELAGHLKVPIKVDGKIQHVTLADAMKGHQLDADYTQKTQALAEQRKQMQAQQAEATERWQQSVLELRQAIDSLQGEADAGLSAEQLSRLMDEDPQEYLRTMARQQAQKERLEKAKRLHDETLAQERQQMSQRMAAFRTEQQRLLSEKMPEVGDPDKLTKLETEWSTYLRSRDFSDEEVGAFFGGPFDHRQVLIIRDAARYRALETGKKTLPKKLQGMGRIAKPGAARERSTERDKIDASKQRLRRLGKRGKSGKSRQNEAALDLVKRLI